MLLEYVWRNGREGEFWSAGCDLKDGGWNLFPTSSFPNLPNIKINIGLPQHDYDPHTRKLEFKSRNPKRQSGELEYVRRW